MEVYMDLIETTANISKKFHRKIVLFRYPDKAWELLATVATGKPRTVTLKTARYGVLSGLIPIDKNTQIPSECSSKEYNNYGKVLTYNGSFVTSDLDILWIERQTGEELLFDDDFGYLTSLEKKIITELNLAFMEFCGRDVKMITHGPYFNHKKPKRSDLIYPYDAFYPNLSHVELQNEEQLKKFSKELHIIEDWP